ncbi:uncharacterized protein N7459_000863 [Penicillium hispanicum]|uniref:uncharacterized protein n=1 Tax=Penicillium hispanicum TaxID=1080232 RepID=UPI00253F6970|nr:uncharacterized protein N7459_000863 [Penicillium hispanicum]KAJ5594655.1 hypothetical protein N7459_000863 [Penicillium hispanicum]
MHPSQINPSHHHNATSSIPSSIPCPVNLPSLPTHICITQRDPFRLTRIVEPGPNSPLRHSQRPQFPLTQLRLSLAALGRGVIRIETFLQCWSILDKLAPGRDRGTLPLCVTLAFWTRIETGILVSAWAPVKPSVGMCRNGFSSHDANAARVREKAMGAALPITATDSPDRHLYHRAVIRDKSRPLFRLQWIHDANRGFLRAGRWPPRSTMQLLPAPAQNQNLKTGPVDAARHRSGWWSLLQHEQRHLRRGHGSRLDLTADAIPSPDPDLGGRDFRQHGYHA